MKFPLLSIQEYAIFIHLLYFVKIPHACAQKIVAAGVVRTGVHVQIGCIVTLFHRFSAVLGSTRGSAGGAQWRSAGFGGNFRRQCKVAFGGCARWRASGMQTKFDKPDRRGSSMTLKAVPQSNPSPSGINVVTPSLLSAWAGCIVASIYERDGR